MFESTEYAQLVWKYCTRLNFWRKGIRRKAICQITVQKGKDFTLTLSLIGMKVEGWTTYWILGPMSGKFTTIGLGPAWRQVRLINTQLPAPREYQRTSSLCLFWWRLSLLLKDARIVMDFAFWWCIASANSLNKLLVRGSNRPIAKTTVQGGSQRGQALTLTPQTVGDRPKMHVLCVKLPKLSAPVAQRLGFNIPRLYADV